MRRTVGFMNRENRINLQAGDSIASSTVEKRLKPKQQSGDIIGFATITKRMVDKNGTI
jgi:hypothetical protein